MGLSKQQGAAAYARAEFPVQHQRVGPISGPRELMVLDAGGLASARSAGIAPGHGVPLVASPRDPARASGRRVRVAGPIAKLLPAAILPYARAAGIRTALSLAAHRAAHWRGAVGGV